MELEFSKNGKCKTCLNSDDPRAQMVYQVGDGWYCVACIESALDLMAEKQGAKDGK